MRNWRRRAGERPNVEEYQERLPGDANDDPELLEDLISWLRALQPESAPYDQEETYGSTPTIAGPTA